MSAGLGLEVISTGIVCAVGLSSESAYTAIRANVSGYAETNQVFGGEGFEPLIGAAVPLRPVPKPGQELARLERLAQLALEECLLGAEVDTAQVAFLLGVAEPHRMPAGQSERSSELFTRLFAKHRFAADSKLLPLGNCAAFEALVLARQVLEAGRATACVVGGVDSLLTAFDVARLERTFRISRESNGQGLVPGEAAAFVVLARAPGSRGSLARVVGVGSGRERAETSVLSTGHPTGRGLIAAWGAAVADAGAHERDVLLRVSDMTGERYAGMDAMLAVSRFFRTDRNGLPLLHPAENVGGTGAAAGGLSLAVAALGLSRGLLEKDGLVLCEGSSEEGLRGAALLRRSERPHVPGKAIARPRLPTIVDEHVEESAFLLAQRRQAVAAPHHDLRTLALLDARIRAHLDGVLAAGGAGFERCAAAMAPDRHGELATAAIVAFTTGDKGRIEAVLEHAASDIGAPHAIVAALAFLPWAVVEPHVRGLRASTDETRVAIGIRAAAAHRNALLVTERQSARGTVGRAAMLRALAELGAVDTLPEVARELSSSEPEVRFWATWGAALLGDVRAASALIPVAEAPGPWAARALDLAALSLPLADAQRWMNTLLGRPGALRLTIQLAGRLGDPSHVPWLITHLSDAKLAKLAGESFSLITGVDLSEQKLDRADEAETGPNDDPSDEDVAFDLDDELPTPDAGAVGSFWERARQHFQPGTRYLCGKDLSEGSLEGLLRAGNQRQRGLASLALALARRGQPLFETRAPAERQTMALGMPRFSTI